MTQEEFFRFVTKAAGELEVVFPCALKNVALCVAWNPSRAQCRESELDPEETLLGLFEGIPRVERTFGEGWVLPDKITLFIDPILDECDETGRSMQDIVRSVLWHEAAHLLGLEEGRALEAERRRLEERV